MRAFRLTQRRVALLCAIVLAATSVAAYIRHNNTASTGLTTKQASTAIAQVSTDGLATTPPQPSTTPVATPTDAPVATTTPTPTPAPTSSHDYTYTATPGDSYTAFVRDAINQFANDQHVTITADQAFTAEVGLANAAGSPELEIGQSVTIDGSAIATELQSLGATIKATAANTTPSTSSDKAHTSANTQTAYTYTANTGDSYTTIARHAIVDLLSARHSSLSPAQRIAAETFLTTIAGSPTLEINQAVTITSSDITQAIDQATSLTTDQIAEWQYYVAYADLS